MPAPDALLKWQESLAEVTAGLSQREHEWEAAYFRNAFGAKYLALVNAFSRTYSVLTEAHFRRIANEYVRSSGDESANLNSYGADFPKYVQQYVIQQGMPINIIDLACYESAFQFANFAMGYHLDFSALATADPAGVKLLLNPSIQKLKSCLAILDLPESDQDVLSMSRGAEREYIIWFNGECLAQAVLSSEDIAIFTAIKQQSLETISEQLPDSVAWMQQAMLKQWLIGVSL